MNKRKRKKAEKKKFTKDILLKMLAAYKLAASRPLPEGTDIWTPETGWIKT
jgi:hypothetical protein